MSDQTVKINAEHEAVALEYAKIAREASQKLSVATTEEKNAALKAFKDALNARKDFFNSGNDADKKAADAEVKAGKMLPTLYDRIDCQGYKFDEMMAGIDDIIALPDPVGKCDVAKTLAKDLNLYRVTCPIGVILVVFEARPDAAVGILGLCLKAGNAVILKGGTEANESMKAIQTILNDVLKDHPNVPVGSVQTLYNREDVTAMYKLDSYVDLIVPRGSNALVRHIKNSTSIPVLGHADGLCTVYVDSEIDMAETLKVVDDSKTNYPAACNALETLLVHEKIMPQFLQNLAMRLKSKSVQYRADDQCLSHLPADCTKKASDDDFQTEFLENIMAVKAVKDVDEAIAHINNFGSHHTDVICTKDSKTADRFMRGVDSSGVYVNCSSRFADGYRYGFGSEVGISTNRIHARGPVGLEGLVTYRYRIYGKGHCVGDFAPSAPEAEKRSYDHGPIAQSICDAEAVAAYQASSFA